MYICIYSSIYVSVVATIRQYVDEYNVILTLLTVVYLILLRSICVTQTCVFISDVTNARTTFPETEGAIISVYVYCICTPRHKME